MNSTLGHSRASVACPRATFSPLLDSIPHRENEVTFRNGEVVCPDRGDVFMVIVAHNILDWKNENLLTPFHARLEVVSHKNTWLGGRFKSFLVFPWVLGPIQ